MVFNADLVHAICKASDYEKWSPNPRLGLCWECKPLRECMVGRNTAVSIRMSQILMLVATQGKTRPRPNDQNTKADLPQLGMWRDHSDL